MYTGEKAGGLNVLLSRVPVFLHRRIQSGSAWIHVWRGGPFNRDGRNDELYVASFIGWF